MKKKSGEIQKPYDFFLERFISLIAECDFLLVTGYLSEEEMLSLKREVKKYFGIK